MVMALMGFRTLESLFFHLSDGENLENLLIWGTRPSHIQ